MGCFHGCPFSSILVKFPTSWRSVKVSANQLTISTQKSAFIYLPRVDAVRSNKARLPPTIYQLARCFLGKQETFRKGQNIFLSILFLNGFFSIDFRCILRDWADTGNLCFPVLEELRLTEKFSRFEKKLIGISHIFGTLCDDLRLLRRWGTNL